MKGRPTLDAASDIEEAILVKAAHVPRPEPAILGEGLGGLLSLVKVAHHHVPAAEHDLPVAIGVRLVNFHANTPIEKKK